MPAFCVSPIGAVRFFACVLAAATLLDAAVVARAQPAPAAEPTVLYAAQGWSAVDRSTFYTTSQGSHMMPYAYFKALRRIDVDEAFGGDQLVRYGYLRSDDANGELPIGFVVDGETGQLGMTCAACHTSQLEYQKDGKTVALRLDGAPALSDFQQLLTDLAAAARATLADEKRFETFARSVLGDGYTPDKARTVKKEFGDWTKQFGEFMDASLPTPPWGPARLDAFGMIFNRVAARDLGLEHEPHDNYQVANAPVSYPFLWNASRQDRTQWNGAVQNGLFIQALARNTGEVFGVFADFKPRIKVKGTPITPTVIDFGDNSAAYGGLQKLEEKIAVLQPPPWPRDVWPIDETLAKKGTELFKLRCAGCHEERASTALLDAWSTPVLPVGTDPKMAKNTGRTSYPGIYLGALRPPPAIFARFKDPSPTAEILALSVVGSLLDEAFAPPITKAKLDQSGVWQAIRKDLQRLVPGENLDDLAELKVLGQVQDLVKARLANLYIEPPTSAAGAAYESRVLYGIWATAPYLHNGSVPSLWELMLPPDRRSTTFKVGSRRFDPKQIGYATDESPFASGTYVVDPQNTNGNGNGGHDYTRGLSDDDRWAIVEYMKTL